MVSAGPVATSHLKKYCIQLVIIPYQTALIFCWLETGNANRQVQIKISEDSIDQGLSTLKAELLTTSFLGSITITLGSRYPY